MGFGMLISLKRQTERLSQGFILWESFLLVLTYFIGCLFKKLTPQKRLNPAEQGSVREAGAVSYAKQVFVLKGVLNI